MTLNRSAWLTLLIAALAIAASLSGLGNDFVYDDQAIIVGNAHIHTLADLGQRFTEPYWPTDRGSGLYRPLTIVLFALQWAIGGATPFVFHLVNVLLYALLSGLVFAVARRLLPEPAAWVVAALFAVHPVHVEAVANCVGQAELTTACAMLAAVVLYLRWRGAVPAGPIGPGRLAALMALYLVACLCKEHGVILPALLLLVELIVVNAASRLLPRLRSLFQPYLMLSLTGVLYLLVRGRVLAAIPDDIQAMSFQSLSGTGRMLTSLALVPQWLRLLFWPVHLQADYSPLETAVVTTLQPIVAVSLLLVAALVALAIAARRRMPAVTLGLGWMGIALLPVSNLLVATGQVLSERTMLLPSVGAMLLVGGLVALASDRLRAPVAVQLGQGAVAALLLVGLLLSALRQPVWASDAGFRAQTVLDAPRSYWAQWMYGDWLFTHGKPAEGERHMRLAVQLYSGNPFILRTLAARYQDNGFCQAATPLLFRTLELRPVWFDARLRLGACLRKAGLAARADSVVRGGLILGSGRTELELFLRSDTTKAQ